MKEIKISVVGLGTVGSNVIKSIENNILKSRYQQKENNKKIQF